MMSKYKLCFIGIRGKSPSFIMRTNKHIQEGGRFGGIDGMCVKASNLLDFLVRFVSRQNEQKDSKYANGYMVMGVLFNIGKTLQN